MYLCERVHVSAELKGIRPPAARDVGGCELPGVGSGNQTCISAKAV